MPPESADEAGWSPAETPARRPEQPMNDTDKGPAFARFYLAQDDYRNALREVRDAERAFNADPTDDNYEAKVEANAAAVYFAAKMAAARVAAGIPHPHP